MNELQIKDNRESLITLLPVKTVQHAVICLKDWCTWVPTGNDAQWPWRISECVSAVLSVGSELIRWSYGTSYSGAAMVTTLYFCDITRWRLMEFRDKEQLWCLNTQLARVQKWRVVGMSRPYWRSASGHRGSQICQNSGTGDRCSGGWRWNEKRGGSFWCWCPEEQRQTNTSFIYCGALLSGDVTVPFDTVIILVSCWSLFPPAPKQLLWRTFTPENCVFYLIAYVFQGVPVPQPHL